MDPGTTTGLAVLDLRGNLLHLSSKRSADDRWILSMVKEYGVPIVVASDVPSPPARVKKIASQFGARIWAPKNPISEHEKDAVVRSFSYALSGPEDDHQRDALVAAYLAYLDFAPKFRQVEKRTEGDRDKEEHVKRAVVFGQSMARAIEDYERPTDEQKTPAKKPKKRSTSEAELHRYIAELKERLRDAERRIDEVLEEKKRLEEELRRCRSGRLPVDETIKRLRMERDDARRRLSEARREIRGFERILRGIYTGKYSVVEYSPDLDAVVARYGRFAVIDRELQGKDQEDIAERIKRIVEEYRSERKKGGF